MTRSRGNNPRRRRFHPQRERIVEIYIDDLSSADESDVLRRQHTPMSLDSPRILQENSYETVRNHRRQRRTPQGIPRIFANSRNRSCDCSGSATDELTAPSRARDPFSQGSAKIKKLGDEEHLVVAKTIVHLAVANDVEGIKKALSSDSNRRSLSQAIKACGKFTASVEDRLNDLKSSEEAINPIVAAAGYNSVEALEELLSTNYCLEMNSVGSLSIPPLLYAAAYGCTESFDLLIKHGANINEKDSDGNSVLHIASAFKNLSMMKFILEKDGHDLLNSENMYHQTSLHISCHKKFFEGVELLLRKKAQVSRYDCNGKTPFLILQSFLNFRNKGRKVSSSTEKRIIRNLLWKLILQTKPIIGCFSSLKDNELCDRLLTFCINAEGDRGISNLIENFVAHWEQNSLAGLGAKSFLFALMRMWNRTKKPIDVHPTTLEKLLSFLSRDSDQRVLNQLGMVFCSSWNQEWINVDVLKVISSSVSRSAKIALYGQLPDSDSSLEYLDIMGSIYFRLSLENTLIPFDTHDYLSCLWNGLMDALSVISPTIMDADRFASLIFLYFLWCQCSSFLDRLNSDHERSLQHRASNTVSYIERNSYPKLNPIHSKKSCAKVIRTSFLVNSIPVSERFLDFFIKFKSPILHIAEDACEDFRSYFQFIYRIPHLVELSTRVRLLQKFVFPRDFHNAQVTLSANRIVDSYEQQKMESESLLLQILNAPAKSLISDVDVLFSGENGIGEGPMREALVQSFHFLLKDLDVSIIVLSPGKSTFALNLSPKSKIGASKLEDYYEACGRIVALSVIKNVPLGIKISRTLLKFFTSTDKIEPIDLLDFDEELSTSLSSISDTKEIDLLELDLNFTITVDGKDVELKENGSSILVTSENKSEYVQLYAQASVVGIKGNKYVSRFVKGFRGILSIKTCRLFNLDELQTLIQGPEHIHASALKKYVSYQGFCVDSDQVKWFWTMFDEMSLEQKKSLLQFWCGNQNPPLFAEDNANYDFEESWVIELLEAPSSCLPNASTCSHVLRFPPYESENQLRIKFSCALLYGNVGYDME